MYTILAISDSDKHFAGAIQEYEKRLGQQIKIQNLKPFKSDNQELTIKKETELLIKTLKDKYPNEQKILLIKEGKTYSTLELSKLIHTKASVFIIGGPYGIDEKTFKTEFPNIKKFSFGAITLPHGLAKLTLIEQIYRASTIWSGKKYHY